MKIRMKFLSRTEKKQQKEKNELLQTYFTSLLSLVLCVTMFLGTTYAWFTSEVNNQANEIYIGILDVELLKQVEDGEDADTDPDYLSLSEADANGVNTNKLFDDTIRWEPGYTALETVKVVNTGELAFKHVLQFTDGSLLDQPTQTLESVAACFDVWVYDHGQTTGNPAPASYGDITAADSGWVWAGSLDQILAGRSVLSGALEKKNDTAVYTIAVHMDEASSSDVMGHRISLNVKLVAYQMTSEQDGFGTGAYDDVNYVSGAQSLREAVDNAEDGDVILLAPGVYDMTDAPLVIRKGISLQGVDAKQKPELLFVTGDGTGGAVGNDHGIEILADNVTLKNLKLAVDPEGISSGNTVQISPNGDKYYTNITIDGCEFYGSDHSIAMYGDNVTIQNCVLDESTADDQGNILYVWGTSGRLTVRNNEFIGNTQKKHGISFYHQSDASKISGEILIEGNVFKDVYKGIVHESDMTYSNVGVRILNNTFTNCKYEFVAINKGTFKSYAVNENVFCAAGVDDNDVQRSILVNNVGTKVDANGNYWGSDTFDQSYVSGDNVTVDNYYADAAKTQLEQN